MRSARKQSGVKFDIRVDARILPKFPILRDTGDRQCCPVFEVYQNKKLDKDIFAHCDKTSINIIIYSIEIMKNLS